MRSSIWAMLCLLLVAPVGFAQNVQVSRENKTIAVTTTESLEVQPEFGVVKIGVHNYAATQDAAYRENGRIAAKIIEALLGAGIKKEDIETEGIQLGRVENDYTNPNRQPAKEQQFQAQQTWNIRLPLGTVQKAVDIAVLAGANDVEDVVWSVKDPSAIEGKLRAVAVAKARVRAEEMAQALGGKVGALLYVSNYEPYRAYMAGGGGGGRFPSTQTIEVSAEKMPILNLFPQKVRQDVTVFAVFALE
jgi:uncharacterized protein YggE